MWEFFKRLLELSKAGIMEFFQDMDNAKSFIWFVVGILVILLPDIVPRISTDAAPTIRIMGAIIIGAKCLTRIG